MFKLDPSKYIDESDLSPDERERREAEMRQYEKRISEGEPLAGLVELVRSRQQRYPNEAEKIADQYAELFAAGFANYVAKQATTVSDLYDAATGAGDDFWDIFRAVSAARSGKSIDTIVLVGLIARGKSERAKSVDNALTNFLSSYQSEIAKQRHAESDKGRDLERVKDCWREWRRSPASYPSKAAFARDMLSKYESLDSSKYIEDLCRKWEKEE